MSDVLTDLTAETEDLDRIVSSLSHDEWEVLTPSPRWAIRDQIGHLTYFDRTAALAILDPDAFQQHASELFSGDYSDEAAMDAATLSEFRAMGPSELLSFWRKGRTDLAEAAEMLGEGSRVEWYGPSMGAKSFLTARLMEAWAHGQDIADAAGVVRQPTDRIRHIAQLGVITRGWSYIVRGRVPPETDVAVVLDAPDGSVWKWGDSNLPDRISGPAQDFCLVVTQRRHIDDTAVTASGGVAREWMEQAQAFAGGPTSGPAPSPPD